VVFRIAFFNFSLHDYYQLRYTHFTQYLVRTVLATIETNNNQRIQHLDIIRGVALLGILIMNIQSFSMPGSVYFNPTSWGDLSGSNYSIWAVSHILADSKFMSIFSILFGAGVCLFVESAERKGKPALGLHYRRNIWLLIFGLVHAHLIWYGDILFSYAMCSFWVVLMRNAKPKTLWITAMVLLAICSLYNMMTGLFFDYIPEPDLAEIRNIWSPDATKHQAEIAAYTGTFSQQMTQRSEEAFFLETFVFFSYFIFRGSALMLIGMALYKSGALSGKKSQQYYFNMMLIGLALGLIFSGYGLYKNTLANFSVSYSMFTGSQWNYWGSVAMALGYIGGLNLMIDNGWLISLQKRLASIGQMAFTHYIAHSIICTFVFYGWGLGLFGQLERDIQILIVISIWLTQLWLSPIWLKHYKFGPLEWAWRSLTYWKLQPFLRSNK
jgi:uncharacterized protein